MNDQVTTELPKTYDARQAKESPEQAKSTGQIVWDAILDLYDQEQVVCRKTLVEVTGLTFHKVDDHVNKMIDNGLLRRLQSGVFVPIPRYDTPRPVYGSLTPDGFFILEVGDIKLVLQPREARMAGALLAGQFVQFSNIQSGHDTNHMTNVIWNELRRVKQIIDEMGQLNQHEQQVRSIAQESLFSRKVAG